MIRRLLISAVLSVNLVIAGDIGGYAGGFLRLGTTARSMALGGGLTAEIDPGWAAFHNPAALVFLDKRHLSMFHHFLFRVNFSKLVAASSPVISLMSLL